MKVKKIECHLHTKNSYDSILTNIFILIMCKINKIDCIAITNHNTMKNIDRAKKFFQKNNILVIPGEEIYTSEGEIIGLFLKKEIRKGMSARDTILEIKKQDGIVCVPHPYDEKRYKSVLKESILKGNYKDIDFIEVHNGRNSKEIYSIKQKELSKKYNISPIIGSDAHSIFEMGRNNIILKDSVSLTKENFIGEIKKAKFVTKKCINWIHIYTKIVKGFKMILRGDIIGLYKIIKKRFRVRK